MDGLASLSDAWVSLFKQIWSDVYRVVQVWGWHGWAALGLFVLAGLYVTNRRRG